MCENGPCFGMGRFFVIAFFMSSKVSTALFGVAKSRRNFRRRFSGSQSPVEIFDDVFRGRKALSKVSMTFFGVAKPCRRLRRHFSGSQSPFESFDGTPIGSGKPESRKKPPVSSPKTPTFVQRKHSSGKNSVIFLADS